MVGQRANGKGFWASLIQPFNQVVSEIDGDFAATAVSEAISTEAKPRQVSCFGSGIIDLFRRGPSPEWGVPLIRFRGEDQKIIHVVGFHEILRVAQFVSGLGGFANDHVFIHAMIFSVAIAINDANLRSWS